MTKHSKSLRRLKKSKFLPDDKLGKSFSNNIEKPKSFKVHYPYFNIFISYLINIHNLAKHWSQLGKTVIHQHLNGEGNVSRLAEVLKPNIPPPPTILIFFPSHSSAGESPFSQGETNVSQDCKC